MVLAARLGDQAVHLGEPRAVVALLLEAVADRLEGDELGRVPLFRVVLHHDDDAVAGGHHEDERDKPRDDEGPVVVGVLGEPVHPGEEFIRLAQLPLELLVDSAERLSLGHT